MPPLSSPLIIIRWRLPHHSSTRRIKASLNLFLLAKHLSTQKLPGSKSNIIIFQGEINIHVVGVYCLLSSQTHSVTVWFRPGVYSKDADTNRKVSWPMCLGRPDWSTQPRLENKSLRVEVSEGGEISVYEPLT